MISDNKKAKKLNYLDESDSSDPWFKLRRQEMLTPGAYRGAGAGSS